MNYNLYFTGFIMNLFFSIDLVALNSGPAQLLRGPLQAVHRPLPHQGQDPVRLQELPDGHRLEGGDPVTGQ